MEILFQTERAAVRRWREADADRLFDILRRPEVVHWLGGRPPMSDPAEAVARIREWNESFPGDDFGYWAIQERTSDRPAGSVILKPLPNGDGEVEVGWHLHPDSWGRGLASEGARGALRHGFGLGLPEIFALTDVDNGPSMHVCRAIGMTDLGVVRDRWYDGESRLFCVTRDDYDDDGRFGGLL